MSTEEKYVAAAYLVVFLFVLLYVLIMAAKLSRLGRDVAELTAQVREHKQGERGPEEQPPRQVRVG